jgi:hypothetical protein
MPGSASAPAGPGGARSSRRFHAPTTRDLIAAATRAGGRPIRCAASGARHRATAGQDPAAPGRRSDPPGRRARLRPALRRGPGRAPGHTRSQPRLSRRPREHRRTRNRPRRARYRSRRAPATAGRWAIRADCASFARRQTARSGRGAAARPGSGLAEPVRPGPRGDPGRIPVRRSDRPVDKRSGPAPDPAAWADADGWGSTADTAHRGHASGRRRRGDDGDRRLRGAGPSPGRAAGAKPSGAAPGARHARAEVGLHGHRGRLAE